MESFRSQFQFAGATLRVLVDSSGLVELRTEGGVHTVPSFGLIRLQATFQPTPQGWRELEQYWKPRCAQDTSVIGGSGDAADRLRDDVRQALWLWSQRPLVQRKLRPLLEQRVRSYELRTAAAERTLAEVKEQTADELEQAQAAVAAVEERERELRAEVERVRQEMLARIEELNRQVWQCRQDREAAAEPLWVQQYREGEIKVREQSRRQAVEAAAALDALWPQPKEQQPVSALALPGIGLSGLE